MCAGTEVCSPEEFPCSISLREAVFLAGIFLRKAVLASL